MIHCKKYPGNRYLFQSKNPARFFDFDWRGINVVLGTTIETNRLTNIFRYSGGANPSERSIALSHFAKNDFTTMVTIEPILDFDIASLFLLIEKCKPAWVNIGADSKRHHLPEPSATKIHNLIEFLDACQIEIKLKSNLKRLYDEKLYNKE